MILLVEDNEFQGRLIKSLLSQEKIETVLAESAEIALEFFNEQNFELIVSDVNLHKIDGYELAKIIKNKNKYIPIYLYSSSIATLENIELAYRIGVDLYIEKTGTQAVCEAIKTFLNKNNI